MVADAAGAAEEEHGGGDVGGEDHGVVACAAGHGAAWDSRLVWRRSAGASVRRGVHVDGWLLEVNVRGDFDAALVGDGVCGFE